MGNRTRGELTHFDKERVQRWIEEAGGSLEIDVPIQEKSVGLKLTGPEAQLAQKSYRRPMTESEQMLWLLNHLKKKGRLAETRPVSDDIGADFFWEEQVLARRILVPKRKGGPFEDAAFAFWLLKGDESRGAVCLLEGSRPDGGSAFSYFRCSTYTLLQSLVSFTRDRDQGVIAHIIPPNPHPNPYAKVDETHPSSLVHEYHNVQPFAHDFLHDPETLLKSWGCLVLPERLITYLARAREYGRDFETRRKITTTFAYPGWIHTVSPLIVPA